VRPHRRDGTAGSIVEQAEKKVLFTRPQHPYTIALLNAIPGRSCAMNLCMRSGHRCAFGSIRRPAGKFHRAAPGRRSVAGLKRRDSKRNFLTVGLPVIFLVHNVAARGQGVGQTFDVKRRLARRLIIGRQILKAVDGISFTVPGVKVFVSSARAAAANRPRRG